MSMGSGKREHIINRGKCANGKRMANREPELNRATCPAIAPEKTELPWETEHIAMFLNRLKILQTSRHQKELAGKAT